MFVGGFIIVDNFSAFTGFHYQLKIHDSKTAFIVFRSPQLKCDLKSLSVNVSERQIT